ncbi:MAG TPA: shikimate dehydrogenase [Steroidobacteraceae bacterium]|nr:shikimate dehydrogenase [Steroidobacteraceae bacterium]HNS26751.1 shikimate dehydrogenase [Steroidobacteraceae bacterium]
MGADPQAEVDSYGVIGHPVAQSRSPFIHGLFAKQTGQRMVYRLFDVTPDDFLNHVTGFFAGGGRGLNVTVPHKPAAANFASTLTPRAEQARAVNTLALQADGSVLGDNTDGVGLVRDLTINLGLVVTGLRLLILGAGGATRGIVAPLLDLTPAEMLIANRNGDRARVIAASFADLGPVKGCGFDEIDARPWDLVINATAASLAGARPEVSPTIIGPHTVCYDLAYGREPTPFLNWALAEGASAAHLGWGMLVEQAAESFYLWRGVRPDTRPVLEVLVPGTR